jgi:hypothetical protein
MVCFSKLRRWQLLLLLM